LLGTAWNDQVRRSAYASMPAAGGPLTVLAAAAVTGPPQWSPDGNGITYPDVRNGISNIFHRTSDGKERQVTRFTSENIYRFAWSLDGKRLAVARGTPSADVLRLTRASPMAR
jgi:Tol biopolymer transport system component